MKPISKFFLAFLLLLFLPANLLANEPPASLSLDGKSFAGRLRATDIGLFNLIKAKGTLSFDEGLLIWSVKRLVDSGPYEIFKVDGGVEFKARIPMPAGDYMDWSGTYDGASLHDVRAIWNRTAEEDFIHDLFLPDVVTFVFKPE